MSVALPTIDLDIFRLAVEHSTNHMIITDHSGKILYANDAAQMITGYSLKEMKGKTPKLWGGLMPETYYKSLWEQIRTKKKPFVGEIQNRRKDGSLYFAEVSIYPILDEQNDISHYVGIEHDITKLKKLADTKSEFVTLASHQLRTPLSAISWFSEMLQDGDAGQLNTKQQKYIGEVYKATMRMIRLVSDLLNTSRLELGTFITDPQKIDAENILDIVLSELEKTAADKSVTIENLTSPKESFHIHSDPHHLNIIFENLLSNAVKYSKYGGKVSVRLSHAADKDLKRIKASGGILLTVKDDGYGIPDDARDSVYGKMYRAENVQAYEPVGTGLGLYIVKSIVDAIGGEIWFDSVENKGTTFHVVLPEITKSHKGTNYLEKVSLGRGHRG